MREEALTHIEPDPLDRVELGRVGRQRQQRDIVRHGEPVRDVPAGLIQDEHGVGIGLELPGEVLQEHSHAGRGCLRQGQGKGLIGAGPAGGKEVEALETLVGQPGWTHAALVPAVAGPAFLADAGLILAPELELGFRMRGSDLGELPAKRLF
jgi:hypothetical protein